MILIPSIDFLGGRIVRLQHGDFDAVSDYDLDPAKLMERYAEEGAEWIHLVNLEASRDGESGALAGMLGLISRATAKVQTGGGVRNGGDIERRLDNGAARVVVGTMCVTETERFVRWLGRYGPDRIVAALDVVLDTSGTPWPRVYGWTEGSDRTLWELLDELKAGGLKHVLCTDIGRDGAMKGPNLDLYRRIVARYPELAVQASGGVGVLDDLDDLAGTGVAAAISGKALLEHSFTVAEAVERLS
jgi:phosphoribosylformimino-5-aminoimidazole carboxamide ribotide isomerase